MTFSSRETIDICSEEQMYSKGYVLFPSSCIWKHPFQHSGMCLPLCIYVSIYLYVYPFFRFSFTPVLTSYRHVFISELNKIFNVSSFYFFIRVIVLNAKKLYIVSFLSTLFTLMYFRIISLFFPTTCVCLKEKNCVFRGPNKIFVL